MAALSPTSKVTSGSGRPGEWALWEKPGSGMPVGTTRWLGEGGQESGLCRKSLAVWARLGG